MTYQDFAAWCDAMGISQTEATRRLGLGINVPASYRRGTTIPLYIALACAALQAGLQPWPSTNEQP